MNIGNLVTSLVEVYNQNRSAVKAGMAIAGVVGTGMACADAATKTNKELEKLKYENKDESPTTTDKIKRVWKYWVKPVCVGGGTIYLIYSSHSDQAKTITALTAMYSMRDNELKEWTKKVEEIAGKKKAEDIKEAIRIDKVQNNPPVENEIHNTGRGDTLCYDMVSGRYFRSNQEDIRKTVNDINELIHWRSYAVLNDFYEGLNVPLVKYGDDIGWDFNAQQKIEMEFSSTLTDDGTPALVVDFEVYPVCVQVDR